MAIEILISLGQQLLNEVQAYVHNTIKEKSNFINSINMCTII